MPLKRPSRTAASDTVGFRLDYENLTMLAGRASRLGVSPHDLARFYVIQALEENEERAALGEALKHLQEVHQELRADLAFAVQALLSSAGKVTPEEAEEWVKQTIKPD